MLGGIVVADGCATSCRLCEICFLCSVNGRLHERPQDVGYFVVQVGECAVKGIVGDSVVEGELLPFG